MMRAKADTKATTTLYGFAAVLLAGSLVGLVWPKPTTKAAVNNERVKTAQWKAAKEKAGTATLIAKATVISRTWSEQPAAIQDKVLTLTATLAKKRGLSFIRLLPQRVSLSDPLEQYPFLLVVEGPFPKVAALEKDLELPANRLAVSLFQITSSDSESDKVSASIGLVAHRIPSSVGTK